MYIGTLPSPPPSFVINVPVPWGTKTTVSFRKCIIQVSHSTCPFDCSSCPFPVYILDLVSIFCENEQILVKTIKVQCIENRRTPSFSYRAVDTFTFGLFKVNPSPLKCFDIFRTKCSYFSFWNDFLKAFLVFLNIKVFLKLKMLWLEYNNI